MSIEQNAEDLLGTCDTFDVTGLSEEDCKILDETARLCSGCGWWVEPYEISDASGDSLCTDCTED